MLLDLTAALPMDQDEMLVVQLIAQLVIGAVFGLICGIMAPDRGRSGVGWFFIGFFLNCVALIILLLIPNLKIEAAKEKRQREETRKLREQLKKERQVADARFDSHGNRLTAHDRALGMDTAQAELGPPPSAPPPLPAPAGSSPAAERAWFYALDGKQLGPLAGAELRALWLDEKVPDSALVWCDGMDGWRPIGEVGDLLGGEDD